MGFACYSLNQKIRRSVGTFGRNFPPSLPHRLSSAHLSATQTFFFSFLYFFLIFSLFFSFLFFSFHLEAGIWSFVYFEPQIIFYMFRDLRAKGSSRKRNETPHHGSRITKSKNRDICTEALARPIARPFACLLALLTLALASQRLLSLWAPLRLSNLFTCSLTQSLTHSRARGKVNN